MDRQQIPAATTSATRREPALLATHNVLRNTYMLLAATLLFSAATAGVSMATNMPYLGLLPTLGIYFGLLFLTHKCRNSAMGIVLVFALTGFLGLTLGPMLSIYLTAVPNGGELVMTSLGLTGLIFMGLSGYVLTTRKDFSFLAGFVVVGFFAILGVIVLSLFMDLSGFQLAISAGIVVLMAGFILFQTSAIIHGGETNYIMATVGLYVSIYNLFTHLLFLLGMGDD